MNSNKVPEGKTVYIKKRKFRAGDILPAWALLEIPEIKSEEIKQEEIKQEEIKPVVFDTMENVFGKKDTEKNNSFNYHKKKKR